MNRAYFLNVRAGTVYAFINGVDSEGVHFSSYRGKGPSIGEGHYSLQSLSRLLIAICKAQISVTLQTHSDNLIAKL